MVKILGVLENGKIFIMNLNSKIYMVRGEDAFTLLFCVPEHCYTNDTNIHIYHDEQKYAVPKIYEEIQNCSASNLMNEIFKNKYKFN